MYFQHYGLGDKPFAMAHNLSFYYPAAHQEATNDLCYSIEERQGLALLVGEPGTGKTTLLRNLIRTFGSDLCAIMVSDVSVTDSSLLSYVANELGLPATDERAPAILKHYFQEILLAGRTVVVLVDEAQSLTDRQLRELHYLTNLEFQNQKLVQLILAGQPSLQSRLSTPSMEALGQRVSVRTYVKPLSLAHTRAYIRLRLQIAGSNNPDLFTPGAVVKIQGLSRGIPRLVNLICDRALVYGYAEDARVLDESAIQEVSDELEIDEPSPGPHPVPDSSPLEQRLSAIEQKLDLLVEAMERGGFLQAASSDSPVAPYPREQSREKSDLDGGPYGGTEPQPRGEGARIAGFQLRSRRDARALLKKE